MRRARIGEIAAARLAGMIAAKKAQVPRDSCAGAERQRIPELHPIELGREQIASADRQRQPEYEAKDHAPERAVEHHADHLPTIGAERHTYADLVGPLCDRVCRHAVQADGGQHPGDDPEQSGQTRHRALLIKGAIQLLLQRPDAGYGQVRVGCGQGSASTEARALRGADR